MKAGRMMHVIEIQSATVLVNDLGTPSATWTKVATLRAEMVEQSTEEFLRGAGSTDVTTLVFRVRHVDGITPEHRVSFDGTGYDIEQIVPIGRRKGLELRCKRVDS